MDKLIQDVLKEQMELYIKEAVIACQDLALTILRDEFEELIGRVELKVDIQLRASI